MSTLGQAGKPASTESIGEFGKGSAGNVGGGPWIGAKLWRLYGKHRSSGDGQAAPLFFGGEAFPAIVL
jgi:hypothetical protein